MTDVPPFDTQEAAVEVRDAGEFNDQQAGAIVRASVRATANLATRTDLDRQTETLRADVSAVMRPPAPRGTRRRPGPRAARWWVKADGVIRCVLAAVLVAAAACSDGGGGAIPTAPTTLTARPCTVTSTGEHTGWWEYAPDAPPVEHYAPLFDIRFKCSTSGSHAHIWLSVSLWADGDLHPATGPHGTIPMSPGEERWTCHDGTGEPGQEDGCGFGNGTLLDVGVSFRWKAAWNVCADPTPLDCVGYPEPPKE